MKKFFIIVLKLFYTLKITGIPYFNNKKSKYIIWAPNLFSLSFLKKDNLQRILSTWYWLHKNKGSASIFTGKKIGRFYNKNIYFTLSNSPNVFEFTNYTSIYKHIVSNLESQNNIIFPNSKEVLLWENKAYMHKIFKNLEINSPETEQIDIRKNNADLILSKWSLPFLIKEIHSCSSNGIYLINDKKDLINTIQEVSRTGKSSTILIQKLLNMRKDLRVILVKDEIVSHYWRINISENWKPTSTSKGNIVDFENFPNQWRHWIIDKFLLLNIRTGAFDIAWENDDLNTTPIILEVSPFYQPNPIPNRKYNLVNYGTWKSSLNLNDNYQFKFVNLIHEIQKKIVETL